MDPNSRGIFPNGIVPGMGILPVLYKTHHYEKLIKMILGLKCTKEN
jgi:hypothetical protein